MSSEVEMSMKDHTRCMRMIQVLGVANEMERDARNEMELDARNERWNEVNC